MGVEPINKVGVDCQIADEFKPLLEVPLQVVGKRAEKHVTSDSIIRLVVDGPYFELHGLETAEILTRSGTALPMAETLETGHKFPPLQPGQRDAIQRN